MNDAIDPTAPPSGPGCLECIREGSWWLHLRRCAACGHVGCCDSSPNQHATRHYEASRHRFVQSFEPGEDWWWDYLDERDVTGPPLMAPTHHPLAQSVPGPAGRVPADWEELLNDEG
ncbi:UBP-type zinc finger domain-containing protein [Microbacterium sp. 1P10UB]|uniref:UBP-type zinc finger domain-containing protein n=1 Tax=unclassified Microbacterium TaxID=2609290 RepID=UPI0039A1B001